MVSVALSAWVVGVSAAGLPLCGCSSALPRASSKDGSFGEVVGASGVPSPPCPAREGVGVADGGISA